MFLYIGLLTLLVLAPLPYGSVSTWAEAMLTFSIFALLASWAITRNAKPLSDSGKIDHGLKVLLIVWGLCVAFAFFQVIPLPSAVIAALSLAIHDLYSWAPPAYGENGAWRALSTTPGSTIQSGILIAACGAAFFLMTRHSWSRSKLFVLAITIVSVGTVEALYGLAQNAGSLSRPATGTFVNRNHFAALLSMALCVGVGLLLSRWQEGTDESEPVSRLDRWARTFPLVLACLTILAGAIFSMSRMGVVAPILTLLLFGGVWMLGPVSRRARLLVIGVGAVLILLMAGAWPALDAVAKRFQSVEKTYRPAAWQGTYAVFKSSPAVGIGLGGLVDNLPRYLPTPLPRTIDHTHNEPLEALAEGGLAYGALIAIGLAVYFGNTIATWFKRRDPLARGLGLGCLAGASAVLLQSLFEFPLRMPANALFLSIIMGIGWTVIHQRLVKV